MSGDAERWGSDKQTAIMDALPHACTIGGIENWRKAADEYLSGLEARGYTIVPAPPTAATRDALAKVIGGALHDHDCMYSPPWCPEGQRARETAPRLADAIIAAFPGIGGEDDLWRPVAETALEHEIAALTDMATAQADLAALKADIEGLCDNSAWLVGETGHGKRAVSVDTLRALLAAES